MDEISWMGKKDPLFPARLKEAWDTQFKKNPQLVLVVCGSVSYILELSGFLSRDFYYQPSGKQSKLVHLRIKDNYLRFYLKHILPLKDKIQSGAKVIQTFSEIKNFESTMGLQVENLILH